MYDNFEQTLGVQDQRSDHSKGFFSVTTCQFLTPMWMPEQGLRQSMFNQAHLLDWTEILYHPGNRRDTEFAKGVSNHFILDAIKAAFLRAIEHRQQSHTMPKIPAPCVE